jgi:hypothetical protein
VPAAGEAARARGPVRAADDRPAWPSSPWRASADWPRLSGRDGWDPPAPPAPPAPPRQPARAEAAPASAPPAAAPATPPLPYRWIGRIDDALGAQALLAGPTRTVAVRVSDVLEGQWRVDAVHEATVTLSWLPTGEQQVLSFRPI